MSFVAAKLAGYVLEPGNVILALLALGAVIWLLRWRRAGAWVAGAGIALYAAIAAVPVGTLLLMPLEARFPPPAVPPAQVDGVIVLGGMIDQHVSDARGQAQLNESGERLLALVELARRYPDAKLVFTGGSGLLLTQQLREADYAAQLLPKLGVAAGRVVFERDSRDTFENAVMSKAVAWPRPEQTWLLVTSARHMPRSIGVFRAQGWRVTAWPVDYVTEGYFPPRYFISAPEGLRRLSWALHEWIGLLAYRLQGRSDALFPGP